MTIRRTLPTRRLTRSAAAATTLLMTFGLAACGSDEAADASSTDAAALTVADPWVKSADTGMTAAFGTLVNDGDADVVVTGVTSELSPDMELHETVGSDGAMQMREKEDGFVVPAGGEVELAPGGNHLMLMDLQDPVRPGEEVSFTLDLEGGGSMTFTAVAKAFEGAEEDYVPSEGGMDMGGDS